METIKRHLDAQLATLTEAGFYAALVGAAVVGTAASLGLVALLAAALGR